ncbi:MAG: LytTR family transcriptional regulator DNA-binding domain-containing protein, partial [Bacteroidetes bacterium]|nr:LytTR family transcriptional regulator DNA-binding domain-containing protein [Bacteroidota bacterium]
LGKLEALLDPEQFFRINRQFIIGFDSISSMFSYSKSRVKIELEPASDIEAIVSIEKSRDFKDWLNR